MYAGNYGFPNAAAGSPYNTAPPPGSQNNHLQPGSGPNQMMYNPQQFPMGTQAGAGFPGNPNMMPVAGPAGMMQNTGMPHMAAANGQSKQLPFICPRASFCFLSRVLSLPDVVMPHVILPPAAFHIPSGC
ncbi:hypothetical protein F4810DRAFT_653296 [Camillea tinctor]|nr:hypothetical protein F4810DRAFT_653296 [Camillea tinctor]